MANLQDCHGMTAPAPKGVITKRQRNRRSPRIQGCEEASFFFWNSQKEHNGIGMIFCVNTIISNHFEMLIGDMNN